MVKKQATTVAATSPLLDVRTISFGYTQEPLMRDVSLRVEAGEMLGLLGPNGSGKTTLLRLLSGLLHPQQGTILLEGRSLQAWGRRAIARRVAVVPQELQVPFAFTVEHMVGLGRTPFIASFWGTLSKQDEIIMQDAMQASGVASLATRIFNELSGGEHQRVLIAMALAQQPAILLLDEPTAHLDLKYQIETLELARQLNRERGVTIIAAMHDLNLAARYFPRLLLFQRGIIADASPTQVLDPALLSRVYGIDVQVGILRGARHLSVLPPDNEPDATDHSQEVQPRVHLMAGGGSGELLMRALADAHIPFSAGPLSIGDSDHVLARRLAQTIITEQPFAPISPAAVEKLRATLAHTDLLILSPFPIGPGNQVLLQEALAAARRGMEVLLLAPPTTKTADTTGDYTKDESEQMLVEMREAGTRVVASIEEVMDIVKKRM